MLGGRRKSIMLALFTLLLLSPFAAAANWYDNIYIWAGISVALSAGFLGMAYMAAKLLELQVLDAWVKIETSELVASCLIAVFCVALIATVNGAAQFLAGESGATDVGGLAHSFLKDKVYGNGQALYSKLGNAYFSVARIASYSYTAGVSVGVASFSYSSAPASGISPLLVELGQGMDSVANFMLLASAQAAFLKFFQSAAAVMLPVGIFLRSFSLTRKIGGVVLAGVIASAVIYPAGFIVSREIYTTFSPEMMRGVDKIQVADAGNPPGSSLVCNPWMQRFVQSPLPFLGGEIGWWISTCSWTCLLVPWGYWGCMMACYALISTMFYIVKAIFPIFAWIAFLMPFANRIGSATDLIGNYYKPLADFALPAVAQFSVLSLVVFFVPLIIAMSMLRSLAITFGGEPQLYGLSKLI